MFLEIELEDRSGGKSIMTCGCGFTRRDVLRAGSLAAAGMLAGVRLGAQAKKGMRIDIHAHLWTTDYLDLCQSYGNVDTGTQRNKGAGMGQEEMDKRFALMEANGVEMQILDICPQAPHFENKEHAVNAARKANDLYAEAVSRWPKKFKAFAAVPLPHVDEALKELERALDQLKFVGATMTTFPANHSPADPSFAPFYEELNRRGTVLYIHPSGNGIDSPFVIPFNLRWAIGAPMEDTVSIMHLIEAGIPQKYPKLKIVNSHLGGMIPMVYQRLDNISKWEHPLPELPSITVKRMWYCSVGHGHPPALRAAVDSMGADRICLGTDYPYEGGELFDHAIQYVSHSGLKPEDAEKILDRNAAYVLGLA
jgi:aminocarboxymuconate-semialdehyde decarboxylase